METLTKTFKVDGGSSREPARHIGTWPDGSEAFESTSIYYTHLVRLEKGTSVRFIYDPGRVYRSMKIPDYKFNA